MLSHDQEVRDILNRLARYVGKVFSVDVGVMESGDKLIFTDFDMEPIRIDGEDIVAATLDEVTAGMHLVEFFERAARAAVAAKYQEIVRSRSP